MKHECLKRGLWNLTLNCLSYHIWAQPVIYIFTSYELLAKFCRSGTNKGFGRSWFTTFTMSSSQYDWWCISPIWIWYTFQKMLFVTAPVSTINERLPQPYLLARLRKWSIMSLALKNEISNLPDYLYIYFFSWR